MAVFARMVVALNEHRPDISVLVVEGRGTSAAVARLPLDLSRLTNLHRMVNTLDPRFLSSQLPRRTINKY